MDITDKLVSWVIRSKYADLPELVTDVTKKSVLDTLAVAVAGSSARGIEQLSGLVKGWGGREESTVMVYGGKVPSPSAALVNCTMARALDFDDVYEMGGLHVNATIVPSAFAISEYSKRTKGRVISGKDFILANALGCDLLCRIRMAGGNTARVAGWVSETYAPIAVAAMGGKMLGFDKDKTLNAMGIAYAQCSGNIQANVEGTLTVRLQQGLAGKAGVLGVVLADIGFTGARDMLEGKYGFYSLYLGGDYMPEVLAAQLGKRFEGNNVSIKPYPCCKYTHGAIYGSIQLADENEIKVDDIKKITVSTSSRNYQVAGQGENKVQPKSVPDAQFSYHYAIATALVKGRVAIEDFTIDAIKNPEVLALARKVSVVVDQSKDKAGAMVAPTDIEIETSDVKRYHKLVETVKGHPENPMSWDEVVQKFKDCSRFSAKPLTRDRIEKITRLVNTMDELDDANTIIECLG